MKLSILKVPREDKFWEMSDYEYEEYNYDYQQLGSQGWCDKAAFHQEDTILRICSNEL